jgi:hypothetical protein
MSSDSKNVRFNLTPEQKNQVKQAIGRDGETLELSAKELEERIAPRVVS